MNHREKLKQDLVTEIAQTKHELYKIYLHRRWLPSIGLVVLFAIIMTAFYMKARGEMHYLTDELSYLKTQTTVEEKVIDTDCSDITISTLDNKQICISF